MLGGGSDRRIAVGRSASRLGLCIRDPSLGALLADQLATSCQSQVRLLPAESQTARAGNGLRRHRSGLAALGSSRLLAGSLSSMPARSKYWAATLRAHLRILYPEDTQDVLGMTVDFFYSPIYLTGLVCALAVWAKTLTSPWYVTWVGPSTLWVSSGYRCLVGLGFASEGGGTGRDFLVLVRSPRSGQVGFWVLRTQNATSKLGGNWVRAMSQVGAKPKGLVYRRGTAKTGTSVRPNVKCTKGRASRSAAAMASSKA